MANYKRGKCRRNAFGSRWSETSLRKRLGLKPVRVPDDVYIYRREWRTIWPPWYNFLSHNPAWHDRTYHTRPHRVATRRVEKAILKGADPDETLWPEARRPQKFYW